MSSTNRGGQRSESDNYPSPPWTVHRLIENPRAQASLSPGEWLEPGAGSGSIIRAVNTFAGKPEIRWTALELREECNSDLVESVGPNGVVLIENYLSPPTDSRLGEYAVAMGNPPYRLAEQFIERSLEVSKVVCFLLRVNFLASAERNTFMRSNTPDIYVLPNRPSFRGVGTDSPEYAWFLWSRERRTTGILSVLATTPKEIRRQPKTLGLEGKRERKIKVSKSGAVVDNPDKDDTVRGTELV